MSELLRCPFCRGEAETWDGAGPWYVVCTECGAIGSPYLSEAEAIEAWNTRAERTCHVVRDNGVSHCSECGAGTTAGNFDYWNHCPNCGAKVVD